MTVITGIVALKAFKWIILGACFMVLGSIIHEHVKGL